MMAYQRLDKFVYDFAGLLVHVHTPVTRQAFQRLGRFSATRHTCQRRLVSD